LFSSSEFGSVMMERKPVSETAVYLNHLSRLQPETILLDLVNVFFKNIFFLIITIRNSFYSHSVQKLSDVPYFRLPSFTLR